MTLISRLLSVFIVFVSVAALAQAPSASDEAKHRITSLLVSQDLVNKILATKIKTQMIKDMTVEFDAKNSQIFFRGLLQVPIEEMKAVNLDPSLGAFRFQMTIKPEATDEGYLVLEFPYNQTYFYPATSKHPMHDKVIVPVQLLSLALASARGYFAALAGDFSTFDRREAKLNALIKALNRSIAAEKNADALDEMKTERASLLLQLAAIPIERKQFQSMSKEIASIMGFMGEKELNLNDELAARQNALIIKIDIEKLAPYLKGLDLGGIRLITEGKGAHAMHYLALDIDDDDVVAAPVTDATQLARPATSGDLVPAFVVEMNQALLESGAVREAEKRATGSKITDLQLHLKQDGLHVSGNFHKFFFTIPFDAIVDVDSTDTDVFEVAVRDVKVASIDFEFLSGYVLESLKARFDNSMKGICTFEYLGEVKDGSRALQVTVSPKALVPAFSNLHLVDVDVRESEFLLKIGEPN